MRPAQLAHLVSCTAQPCMQSILIIIVIFTMQSLHCDNYNAFIIVLLSFAHLLCDDHRESLTHSSNTSVHFTDLCGVNESLLKLLLDELRVKLGVMLCHDVIITCSYKDDALRSVETTLSHLQMHSSQTILLATSICLLGGGGAGELKLRGRL